jgi:hypothetical protein
MDANALSVSDGGAQDTPTGRSSPAASDGGWAEEEEDAGGGRGAQDEGDCERGKEEGTVGSSSGGGGGGGGGGGAKSGASSGSKALDASIAALFSELPAPERTMRPSLWVAMARRDVPRGHRAWEQSRKTVSRNCHVIATSCVKEIRRRGQESRNTSKETVARAKKMMREMLT